MRIPTGLWFILFRASFFLNNEDTSDFPHYGHPLAEIGHIWFFGALPGERVGVNVEGRAEAYFRHFALSSV